jgi:phosphopantetheinyl transferase
VSVGNDVVDLADPETRLAGLHPRWGQRVFSVAERAALETSRSRHRLHWMLWAAKESAFKARKRLDAGAVFSPLEFEVELPALPAAGDVGVAAGRVFHRGVVFGLEVRLDGTSVHAVATSEEETGARVLWKVARVPSEPGTAARRLAATAIGSALDLDPTGLRVVGRPPVFVDREGRIEVEVSLSHHGRFVAFACTLPRDSARTLMLAR